MASKENPIGKLLREKRIASAYSQADVAYKLGYSTPQFVSNWERGESHPPVTVLKKLAQLYGCSAEELFEVVLEVTVKKLTDDLRHQFKSR